MRRIEQLRAWLFPIGATLFAVVLLLSLASPRAALIGCFGGAALLSSLLWAVSVYLSGGKRQRLLFIRGHSLLKQASALRGLSPEDETTLRALREELLACLKERELTRLTQAIDALDKTITRLTLLGSSLRELLAILALAFFFALFLKAFIVEPFHIPSGSMYPTLHIGDHIFVNKFIYGLPLPRTKTKLFSGWRLPERGEVIVFHHDQETDYIKRVVAIPGDTIDVFMTEIIINGERLPREYIGELSWQELDAMSGKYEPRESNYFTETNGGRSYKVIYDNPPTIMPSRHFVVPPGEYMVLGDNRDHSFDSMHWGFVPLEEIQGRAMFVLGSIEDGAFNWNRIGLPIE